MTFSPSRDAYKQLDAYFSSVVNFCRPLIQSGRKVRRHGFELQPLEGRQLLSSAVEDAVSEPVPPLPSPVQVFHVTRTTSLADRTFIDNLNNRVTLRLVGNGTAALGIDPVSNKLVSLNLVGTDARSSLAVIVSAAKSKGANADATGNGTGQSTIGDISISGAFSTLNAAKLDLRGNFESQGAIANIQLGNVSSTQQQSISLLGTGFLKTNISLGRVQDLTLSSNSAIGNFRAIDWQDSDVNPDAINARSIGSVRITGARQTTTQPASPGDFEAAVQISGNGSALGNVKALGSLYIAGTATSQATWDIQGNVGSINLAAARSVIINVSGNLNRFYVADDVSQLTQLDVTGYLQQLTAAEIFNASVSIGAGIGLVNVKGAINQLQLTTGVNIEDVFSGSKIGQFTAAAISDSTINAGHVGNFAITGLAAWRGQDAIAGNADGLTLNVQSRAAKIGAFVLGRLYVRHALIESEITVSDSATMIDLGSIDSSNVLIGFNPGALADGLPTSLSDFSTTAKGVLSRFIVSGRGLPAGVSAYVSSSVVATVMQNINLVRMTLPTDGEPTGIVTTKVGTFTLRSLNLTSQLQLTNEINELEEARNQILNITSLLKSLIP